MTSVGPDAMDGREYDAYVAARWSEMSWAEDLASRLRERGVEVYGPEDVGAVTTVPSREATPLLSSRTALVVLWSDLAGEAPEPEVPLRFLDEGVWPVIPVLVAPVHRERLPAVLDREDALVFDPTEEERLEGLGPVWERLVQTIVDRLRGGGQPETLPDFSANARQALAIALHLLGDDERPVPARLRTAVLVGALLTSARVGARATTGTVVRLVFAHQTEDRTVAEALGRAAVAAGLVSSFPDGKRAPPTAEALLLTAVGPLVREAIAAAARTAGAVDALVHTRHVLVTGIDRAVPRGALTELGVTLEEVVRAWRDTLSKVRPEEYERGWSAILDERRQALDGPPPTARVHTDRWTMDDNLDHRLYAKAIAAFVDHEQVEPPLVISIQAPWGQGKTSLMHMVQDELEKQRFERLNLPRPKDDKDAEQPPGGPTEMTVGQFRKGLRGTEAIDPQPTERVRTVWFNAWKYQSSEQIWAGLAHAILTELTGRLPRLERERFWLNLQRARIDPAAVRRDIHAAVLEKALPWLLAIAAAAAIALVAAVPAGGSLGAAAALAATALTGARLRVDRKPLEGRCTRYVRQPDYEGRLGFLHLVEEDMTRALNLLAPEERFPIVVFIDDLDRCAPAKIAEVVEAVNLFLAGDFERCAFVIGIDAEVVAASMSVVHADIIEQLGGRGDELGWRFLDKFVQLPFVVPQLSPEQRTIYMEALFQTARDVDPERVAEGLREVNAVTGDLRARAKSGTVDPEHVGDRAAAGGEGARKLGAAHPEARREMIDAVITAAAAAFSDDDRETAAALSAQAEHFSDNPRTIKRAVNLYRFHRFAAWMRSAAGVELPAATSAQIARWVVVIVRWPQLVRWLQTCADASDADATRAIREVVTAARETDDVRAFAARLEQEQGRATPWARDAELWRFLRADVADELALDLAAARGLW